MRTFVKTFSCAHRTVLENEINSYAQDNNLEIISATFVINTERIINNNEALVVFKKLND
jgi:hypothetical protein